ncbi:MAG: hypothetical protein WA970_20580 [Gammaproteobacteria bacterium]
MVDLSRNDEERFVDEERDWIEGETPPALEDIDSIARDHVMAARQQLVDTSKTAAAIDRNAPWMEIAQCATEEGHHELAGFLFEAEQQGLDK